MIKSRIAEVTRFVGVGAINTVIDLLVFSTAFYLLDLHLLVANTLAYCVATANSYVMNKYWTFAGRGSQNVSTSEIARFIAFNVVGLFLSNVTVAALVNFMTPIAAKFGAIGVSFAWNYFTIRRFVFRESTLPETE